VPHVIDHACVRLHHDDDAVFLEHREPELVAVGDDRGLRKAEPVAEEVARRLHTLDDQDRGDRLITKVGHLAAFRRIGP